jgi:dTDP-4-dehydrorhamnose reductase
MEAFERMSDTMEEQRARPLELWGGVECTVNRLGDDYRDQLAQSGHAERLDDLERFAELGLKAIRYPVLWERAAPIDLSNPDWSWTDERLARLRELKLRPIAGLLHHGSGPLYTSLVENSFPSLFAAYARQVAERYPWIDAYTPINEPLTTARFSGLYGIWFPHHRTDRSFVKALLNQCQATVLAMRAIRSVNPSAQLVQTEDLAKIHSTPALAYQARFENRRRWLSFDLLCGRVNKQHPLWKYLLRCGASEEQLAFFQEYPCPPDIIGCNHYLTSERYLDEEHQRFPPHAIGGNKRHRYADVEAVRAIEDVAGLRGLLEEAWQRYQLPLAITEVHLGCHREAQLRWLIDAWQTAQQLRERGVDLRAVTSWSLLGSFDWNSLCTRREGYYEAGAFDLSSGQPRPTAIAKALSALSRSQSYEHPALPARGWWNLSSRLIYARVAEGRATPCEGPSQSAGPPLLILGAGGTLGRAFEIACQQRGLAYRALTRKEVDVTNRAALLWAIEEHQPWAIVNAAGYVRVDDAERDFEACRRANADGPANLAIICANRGIKLATFSSDLVFDGDRDDPYLERHAARPLSVYGQTKAEAERRVLVINPQALVIRTSAFFGPWDDANFLTKSLSRIARGESIRAADDWIVSPTYVPDLVHAAIDLLIDDERGLWHLANEGATSWSDFARQAAQHAGLSTKNVLGIRGSELRLAAPRPRFSALGSERGRLLPPLASALARYAEQVRPRMMQASSLVTGAA